MTAFLDQVYTVTDYYGGPRAGMADFGGQHHYYEMDEEQPAKKRSQIFRLGDTVRIVSGPFTAFTAKIEGINQSKALLKVKVAIFGRKAPIKLRFTEVEKISSS